MNMSNWTKEEIELEIRRQLSVGNDIAASMIREYAAHLAAQTEWPSDEDCRALLAKLPLSAAHTPIEMVRAALQSVRPPVGVVSDEDLLRYAVTHAQKIVGAKGVRFELWFPALPSQGGLRDYLLEASRHAPTKD